MSVSQQTSLDTILKLAELFQKQTRILIFKFNTDFVINTDQLACTECKKLMVMTLGGDSRSQDRWTFVKTSYRQIVYPQKIFKKINSQKIQYKSSNYFRFQYFLKIQYKLSNYFRFQYFLQINWIFAGLCFLWPIFF